MKYYIKEYECKEFAEEIPEDVINKNVNVQMGEKYEAQSLVEDLAEYYFNNNDGWEASWPLIFIIIDNNKEYEFLVEEEVQPVFYATFKKKE